MSDEKTYTIDDILALLAAQGQRPVVNARMQLPGGLGEIDVTANLVAGGVRLVLGLSEPGRDADT